MKIREAIQADFTVLSAVLVQVKEAASLESQSQFNWTPQSLSEELLKCRALVVGSQDGQRVFSFLCFRESLDFFEITVLATLPEKRNQGLQTLLIKELLGLARKELKPILLEVHEENYGAIRLYKQLGFREISRRKSYYGDGKTALIFQYALSSSVKS